VRFFVTGIGGFAGTHLAEHLLACGDDVTGSVTARPDRPALRALATRHPRFDPARLATVDLGDRPALARALTASAPDGIFHLAGIAFPPRAELDPPATFAVNVLGTVNLLAAAAEAAPGARIVIAGSADAYGAIAPEELPITEHTPLRPVNLYGLTKAAADMAAFQHWWTAGAAIVRARPFNHTGPGQSADFVCSDFARQIARIEAGLAPPVLRVGNLSAVRDFSDVRDVVRGYRLLLEHGTSGAAYNLCSGTGTSIRAIVEALAAASGRTVECVEEPGRLRRREIPRVVGDAARAAALGWSPRIALADTLRDLLEDWRARIRSTPA
jgi:GDP-4-dehydro-6-deoxy-D-mannose reductase